MVKELNPSPNSLGLASPALGAWFRHDDSNDESDESPSVELPRLPMPNSDLSVTLSLAKNMQWRTPATATRSYLMATPDRPPALRGLRQENGEVAFTNNSLVVLLTLLPEVELRLWALTEKIPSPDGTTPPESSPGRPRVRWLAMEVPDANNFTVTHIEKLREADLPNDIDSNVDCAAFLGLDINSTLANAAKPVHELRRPESPSAVALQNRNETSLEVKLWCFDYLGRPLDPGAVANWWSYLASEIWDNLWADEDEEPPLTAAVDAGRVVHLTNAHEGPVDTALQNQLRLTNLVKTESSRALYQATPDQAIALDLAADADTDVAPLARIAALPLGDYASPDAAGPFDGWIDDNFPATMSRDFLRIGCLDIEQHIVGLSRTPDTAQADPRRRLSPARNTTDDPFLTTSDAVTGHIMATLAAGKNMVVMAPVMDRLWGQSDPPEDFGNGEPPDTLDFTVHAIAGEGDTNSTGDSVSNQRIAVRFKDLPAGGWVRLWTHGLDTQTGRRFRQHGGAGLADADGNAWVTLPLPDGTAAPDDSDNDANPVPMSFDVLVITNNESRYFSDQRFDRPATINGERLSLPDATIVSTGLTLWLCEQGAPMNRSAGEYASGQTLLAISDDDETPLRLVDLDSLDTGDINENTLHNASDESDTLIVTEPAFGQTPDGDLSAAPHGGTLVKRTRNKLNVADVTTMGRPAPSQERRELAAYRAGNKADNEDRTGVIGATPNRAENHEAPPIQLGHPGVPAAAEIHGVGYALAGPAADALGPLMTERRASNLHEFIRYASVPIKPTPDVGGTTGWAVVLETSTFGVTGDAIIRSVLADNPDFAPGQEWQNLKAQIESKLSEQAGTPVDIDELIDSANFDDDALAAALDRMILKTRDGVHDFANAVLAAVKRAEDFIYLETPAIDALNADSGNIDLLGAIKDRWESRPDLRVLLCVPEKFLPDQISKLEYVRQAGVKAALAELRTAGGDRVQLFSPIAGPGRPAYLASTSVIVDDAIMLTGSTHLWRRGLTFDSSLAVGLFDENVAVGRPAAVRAARRILLANALGLPENLLPEDSKDCIEAITQLNAAGGLGRVNPSAYHDAAESLSEADKEIWNPDGRPDGTSDWLTFFADLTGDADSEFNNAIR